jgi:hypothetical protein
VRDARKTAEATKELGALIANEPTEVPGGDMVFTGVDRQGARFAAHSKARVAPPPTPAKRAKPTKTTTKATKITTKGTKKSKGARVAKKAGKKAAPKKKAARKPSRRR